ncbi:MAG: GNAT family N-acetyltransferase [Chloroflexota bacterium]|jgi:RimJ/RimL family protein N-acetyltransferase|nr:GNAT family N-acetyltransferase [Chloroflexota bacterium]MDQ3345947.1 GNAT family N-acetyltransferase [Chloroflexota bacterium]
MAVAASSRPRARAVSDRGEIAAFLRRDRLYAAYALGDLDGPNRARVAWALAHDDAGQPTALAMHHEGLVPQPLFLMGAPAGCRAILDGVLKPRDAYLQATELQEAALRDLYELDSPIVMLRMAVDRHTFTPFAGPADRLTALDIDDLNRLYQLGYRGGFPASVVEDGVYYGVRVRGRLVSAAGTHAINPREEIAVVGNVMTHVDYRGHDFAKMVTSAVTADLLARVTDVALNVHADNDPAVAAYARLGYRTHCQLIERLARRRAGGWGLMRPIREAIRFPWPREPK